jgi:signal transduction histidine kinase
MEAIKEYENGLTADKIKTEDMKSREFSILLEEMLLLFRKLEKAKKELEEFYQQRMQRADKLATIGELASSVAHEIKNPLAGINGVIQVLLKDEEIPYKAKEILREILNLTARLDRTVHNLLRFSKDTPAQFSVTNINEIIKKTLFIIEQQAITSKVVLQIQLDSSIPDSLMDEEQIVHLLINIILNAIQAMPDGGKISIKTSLDERDGNKYIKVSISDTGVGIPEGIRDKIFDPFFTTRPHGTGLGLYICKRIIKAHNGEIWVESEENRGSTFYFIIPLKTDE